MLRRDTREGWRQMWLESINELTSLELQKKKWLDYTDTNPHWSFVEFTSCYFDDVFVAFDDHYYSHCIERGLITQEEHDSIREWHEMLDNYNPPDKYDHAAILNDPQWLQIVKVGESAKRMLAERLDPEERAILMETEED